jgi:hypothetical protein
VGIHPVDKLLEQHCYKSAAGSLQLVPCYNLKFRPYKMAFKNEQTSLQTSCYKSVHKMSTSCVHTACPKLSTSLEQAVNNL